VKDWPHSTFHRYVHEGVYDQNWGGAGIAINENKNEERFGE